MPRRRWGAVWLGDGPSPACPRRIVRFLEPCLLLLLREDASHGYNLLDALQSFGFVKDSIDASVVYRILREMEQAGWVSSEWDTEGSGPSRRIYHVTDKGEEYLRWWIADLQRTRDEIDNLIAAYGERGGQEGHQSRAGDGLEAKTVPG
jgi:PadR family transcriptional regulator, regulatory protein PadR